MTQTERTRLITVRFAPEEAAALRERARRDGCTYSALLRRAVLRHCDERPITFFWRAGDNPNITVDYTPFYADAS
jgi:hypothetical protein